MDTPREAAAYGAIVLIRLMVGAVFLTEGVQKFLLPGSLGPGRFATIGFPHPAFWAYFVGAFETVCGVFILLGLMTRLAAVPTTIIMVVALLTTKLPVLLGRGLGPFRLRELSRYGFFSFTHEARTDWSMLLGSLFLVVAGSGAWSLDAALRRRRRVEPGSAPPGEASGRS